MVVFVDYDNEPVGKHTVLKSPDALQPPYVDPGKLGISQLSVGFELPSSENPSAEVLRGALSSSENEQQNSTIRNAFSVALGCYPIAKEIARSVDLSTLYALSVTCRQFYANLGPYRHQLAKQTLRCENEYIETLSDMLQSGAAIPDSVKSVIRLLSRGAVSSGQLTSGKIAKCARDMVAECRGCSKVVCRNCTAKPPNSATLKNRIRRLCTTCRRAPLNKLVASSLHAPLPSTTADATNKTSTVLLRDTCTCQNVLWLCNQCGQKLRRNDTTYRRVWTWRTRYSTYLGGLGTGIGEGCQGVKCGRGESCLAGQEIELEVECEADESMSHSPPEYGYHFGHRFEQAHHGSHNHSHERWEDPDEKEPGYLRQEIIGIGGRVKQRAKKRVMVGACVVEHEDERETGDYLTREEEGTHRSWCGWCWRVIPAKHEVFAVQNM
ncbi:hypothetical protein ASPSYDRAFT_199958 [Aspergillus sydowii CBS 593.65]|uniref:Uncharacterized protein n=1 Tax=Aspergillus sydowii CBS 593.65 TaxID=1036612 RepID=A0A1L9TJ53_9EURO|nr:uncharacterized protein ASPSYDRAFT_199958 [Aspergillus sydowii CBS 593.65]OJJ59442.1 hypothetical protein ASPSYDRAFT_199958 [Aspergillus sydowii CBS 593.65]